MKVKWLGDPETRSPDVEIFGTIFPEGEDVDIGHLPLDQQKKLVDNPTFEAADNDAKALHLAPAAVKEKKTDMPRASEFADIWNRLKALEADLNTLRGAVLGPDPAEKPVHPPEHKHEKSKGTK